MRTVRKKILIVDDVLVFTQLQRTLLNRQDFTLLTVRSGREAIDKAGSCSECGECLERCPYQLPIPDLIKGNLAWLKEQMRDA